MNLASTELPGARVSCLFAKPGAGKTTVSRARAALWPRVLFLDSKARHTGMGEYPGMVATTGKELAQLLRDFAGRERWRISYRGPVAVPVDPSKPDKGLTSEAFFRVMARIPDFLLVVEEAETYMSASYCPAGLFDMVRQGRTIGQAVTVCAHRPADVARDLTAVADEIITWPMHEPRDREAIAGRGFDLALLDTLAGHESIRMHAPEGEIPRYYICRCSTPHAGKCGEPVPLPPRKVPHGDGTV